MTLRLKKVGNSSAILITREMKRYLGIDDDTVDLDYQSGKIVIQKPRAASFEDAVERTFTRFAPAMTELAKPE